MLSVAGDGSDWRASSHTLAPTFNRPNVTSQHATDWQLNREKVIVYTFISYLSAMKILFFFFIL